MLDINKGISLKTYNFPGQKRNKMVFKNYLENNENKNIKYKIKLGTF